MTNTDEWTIDADTHVYDPISVWTDYMDPAFVERAPAWLRSENGRQMLRVGDLVFPTVPDHPGFARIYGPESTVDRSGNDPHERLRLMDKLECEIQVVFPTLGMTGFSLVADPALSGAYARAYNRYMAEFCSVDPHRLWGAMSVPFNHPDLAVAEMQWAREQGLRIAFVNPTPPGDIPWSDDSRARVWAAAQDLDITVVFHEVTTGCPPNAIGVQRYGGRWPMIYLVTHVLEAQLGITDLILGGVLERNPRLRVGAAEAHVAWLPGWLEILDHNFGEGTKIFSAEAGETALTMKPSDYFRRQCFLAAFPDDPMVGECLRAVGDQNILMSSDWPHPIAEDRSDLRYVRTRADLTEDQQSRVLRQNALTFLP